MPNVRQQGKGDDRPINPLENRAAVAAALASVDLVTWFDDDTAGGLKQQRERFIGVSKAGI